jgi:hypothetical protein
MTDNVSLILKAVVVTEIIKIAKEVNEGSILVSDVENGIEVKTPNCSLFLRMERELCEWCEEHPRIYSAGICDECNKSLVAMYESLGIER